MFNKDLSYGNLGKDVYRLQKALNELNYGDFICTGFFGDKTLIAIKKFQSDNGIEPVKGFFGPKTRERMNNILSDKNREKIYKTAKSLLNTDVTPDDIVPDEYNCSDTVCVILKKAGFDIGNYPLTTHLYNALFKSNEWQTTLNPKRGDIIISPTGYGNGSIPNGHVGIVSDDEKIMSNTSADGIFRENYTFKSWINRYKIKGGYPIFYFRKI